MPRFESTDTGADLREAFRLATKSGAHVTQVDGGRLSVAASVADTRLTVWLRLDVLRVNGRCDGVEEPALPTPRWSVEAVETGPRTHFSSGSLNPTDILIHIQSRLLNPDR